jgi:hypothetical protein
MNPDIRRLLTTHRPSQLRMMADRLGEPHSDYLARQAATLLRQVADELEALPVAEDVTRAATEPR